MSILFYERRKKFKLFWFFVLALRVGEKPKVLKCAVGFALLPTVWLCVVWDFETINFQFTTNFIYC